MVLAMLLACSSVATYFAATTEEEPVAASTVDFGQQDNIQNGVILHCWNWSYNNIKKYLPQIAAAGYTAVQTSPVTQPKDYYWEGVGYGNVGIPDGIGGHDGNWWKVYQPVTASICDNGYTWFGTKAEFKSMCDEAEKYGIKVIVDIVANHMGNIQGYKIGSVEAVMGDISRQVGQFWNPDMLTDSSYWHISTSWTHSSDGRFDVTQGNMGMPDLNTGDSKVQNMILNLMKECIDNGADGFRFDAAKHIETPADDASIASKFWDVVLDGTTAYAKSTKNITPYYYGEILNRIDSTAAENYYLSKMSVTDNSTGDNIRNSLKYGGVGGASNTGYAGYAHGQGNKVVLWAESHDTYMGGGSSYDCNDSTINKAWAIVASRKDSTGLYFARPYYSYERLNGDQNGYDARKDPAAMEKEIRHTQMGEVGTLTWMDPCVAEVNRFRNHFVGQSESIGILGDNLYYNVRGNSGVVLVNTKGAGAVSVGLSGKMKDGTYTDQVSGNKFTVSGGTISGTIANKDGIAVIYNTTTVPRNTIEAPRENFIGDTASITVGLNNATSGTYSINGGAPVQYTSDTTFTIGAGDAIGTEYDITLTATDGSNSTSATFTFTKSSQTVDYPIEEGYTTPTTTPVTEPTTVTTPVTEPTTAPQPKILIGDADLNGKISISDATTLQQHIVETITLTGDALVAADVNKDGSVNIKDATAIQYYLVDLIEQSYYCGQYVGGSDPTAPTMTGPTPTTPIPTNTTIYFKAGHWTEANAWFSVYAWDGNGGETFVKMTEVSDGVYAADLGASYANVIFCRNDPAKTAVDWSSAWNQTADLTVQSGCNCFTINSGEWTGATGTWSTY